MSSEEETEQRTNLQLNSNGGADAYVKFPINRINKIYRQKYIINGISPQMYEILLLVKTK